MTAEKERGGPRKEAAPKMKQEHRENGTGNGTRQGESILANADRIRPRAEHAARQIIASWVEYGPKQANQIDPDIMPTGPLRQVAEGVLYAMLTDGVKDLPGLVAYFAGAPDGTRAELGECAQTMPPAPTDCRPLLDVIRRWHREHRRDLLAHRLKSALEHGDDAAEILREFAELEAESSGKTNLRERAYAMRFDPSETPPPDESCMMIGDVPIAARGNLTVIQGKSKVGKSAVVSAILAAAHRGQFQAQGDMLCIGWAGESNGAIIHLDTEQSRADWHGLVSRSITRSGIPEVSPRLVSLPLVMFARSERLEILRQTLEHENGERGGIDLVIIDGIADLCASPNDEGEALELVSRVMALSQKFTAPVFCILHENPGTEQAKTRGHLGSELNRKAFANLRIDKDGETAISTIYGTDMRKRDIPKDQGFCFAWDAEAGMHTFQGRAAGLKAAHREAESIAKSRAEWEPIFEFATDSGTNGACPALTPNLAAEAERDMGGTGKLTKTATMKKRMQRAESLGVLRKSSALEWALNPRGTSGT